MPPASRSLDPAGVREEAEPRGSAIALIACSAAALGYTALQLRAATPADGAAATPEFYSRASLALPAAATLAYLLMCRLGPRLMASRPALSCKSAMLVYNAYQALFNAACVALFVSEVRGNALRAWGNVLPAPWHDQPRFARIGLGLWLHYNNKAR